MENTHSIILASSSPRRQELLKELGLIFSCRSPDVPEIPLPNESPEDFVKRLALSKALAVHTEVAPPCLIIAGDTSVILGNQILGKPVDKDDAKRMLHALSGQTHYVITGVCLLLTTPSSATKENTFAVKTNITFKSLTADQINTYVQTGDPMDKAGSYGIQSGAGSLIESIDGSYSNVVGLPMERLGEELKKYHV